jgi:hypothetical protein
LPYWQLKLSDEPYFSEKEEKWGKSCLWLHLKNKGLRRMELWSSPPPALTENFNKSRLAAV